MCALDTYVANALKQLFKLLFKLFVGTYHFSRAQTYQFFVAEKCVRQPNLLGHLCADVQRLNVAQLLERQARVVPRLSEVKVRREVHHDFAHRADREDSHRYVDLDGRPAVVGAHSFVVAETHEPVEDACDFASGFSVLFVVGRNC